MPPREIAPGSRNAETSPVLLDMARQLTYSALQRPVAATAQLIDGVASTNLTEKATFMEQPAQAKFGSVRWHAEQLASGIGSAVPYLVAMALTKTGLRAVNAETAVWKAATSPIGEKLLLSEGATAATIASRYRAGEAVGAGFLNAALFQTSDPEKSLLTERLKQGTIGGVTMGTMHVLSNKLGNYTGANGVNTNALTRTLTATAAGAGAGIVASLTDAAVNLKAPTVDGIYQSAYTTALTGATLSLASDGLTKLHQPKSSFPDLAKSVADTPSESSFLNDSEHEFLTRSFASKVMRTIGKAGDTIGLTSLARSRQSRNGELQDGQSQTKEPHNSDNVEPPQRSLRDLSPIERVEAIAKMEQTGGQKIFTEAKLQSFISRLNDATKDWHGDKLKELQQASDAADARLEDALRKVEDVTTEAARRPGIVTVLDEGSIMISTSGYADVKAASRELEQAQEQRDNRSESLDNLKKERTNSLQNVVNDFLHENGLPSTEVSPEHLFGAWASFGNGKLSINQSLLDTPRLTPEQVSVIAHELTHLAQFSLMIRAISQHLNIRDSSDESIAKIKNYMGGDSSKDATKFDPQSNDSASMDTFFANAIRLSQGQKLSPAEQWQAYLLLRGAERYESPWTDTVRRLSQTYHSREAFTQNTQLDYLFQLVRENPKQAALQLSVDKLPPTIVELGNSFDETTSPWSRKWRELTPEEHQEFEKSHAAIPKGVRESFIQWSSSATKLLPYDGSQINAQFELFAQVKNVVDDLNEPLAKKIQYYERKNRNYYHANKLELQAHPVGLLAYLVAQRQLGQ